MNTKDSRLTNVMAAQSIWETLVNDDREASEKRAKIDSLVNGELPFDQNILDETGQGDAANFNDRELSAEIAKEKAAYIDLISRKLLVDVEVDYGDRNLKRHIERKIASSLSKLIRSDDTFEFNYVLAITQNIQHGLGVIIWPHPVDYRFRGCGWADFKIPRDTKAMESCIQIAMQSMPMEVSDLYSLYDVCKGEEDSAWNTPYIKKLIESVGSDIISSNSTTKQRYNFEYVEQQIKENAAQFGAATSIKIWVVNVYLRENDGSITHARFIDPNSPGAGVGNTEWIYFEKSKYDTINDVMCLFTYDIPISGTYHASRGKAWTLQPQALASNILTCRVVDGATSSTMTTWQVANPTNTDMEKMSAVRVGNNEFLPPGVTHVSRQQPDFTKSVLPIIGFLRDSQAKNNHTSTPITADVDGNAPAIAQQISAQANASISAVNLGRFYRQLDKVYNTMFKRIKNPDYREEDPGGKGVIAFKQELAEQGITQEILEKVTSVKARRTIGAGSATNRLLSLQRLEARKGEFDPEGRRNLTYDITVEEVGEEIADRYCEPVIPNEQRQPVDVSIAAIESILFESAKTPPVLPNQDHFTHVSQHLPPLMQRMDALEKLGENATIDDLSNTHAVLMAALPHISTHTQFMSVDRSRIGETKQLIKVTQQLDAAGDRIRNQIMRLQKAQQQQMEAEAKRQQDAQQAYIKELESKVQQAGPDASKAQALLIEAQVKARIMEEEHAMKLRHKEEDFQLEKALKDARNTADMIAKANEMANATSKEKQQGIEEPELPQPLI